MVGAIDSEIGVKRNTYKKYNAGIYDETSTGQTAFTPDR